MSESDEWGLDGDGDDDDRKRHGLRSRMGRLLQPLLRSLRPRRMKKPGRRTAPDFGPEPAWSRGSEEDYYGRPDGRTSGGKPSYGRSGGVAQAGVRRGAGEGSAEPDDAEETLEGETQGDPESEAAEFGLDVPDWFGDGSEVEDGLAFEPYGDEGKALGPSGDGNGLGAAGELGDGAGGLSDGEPGDMPTSGDDLPDWPTEIGRLPDDAGATGNPSGLAWPDDLMAEELAVGGAMPELGPDPLGTDVGVAFDPQLDGVMGLDGVLEIADPFAPDPGEGKPGADPFGEDPFAGWEFDKPGNVW